MKNSTPLRSKAGSVRYFPKLAQFQRKCEAAIRGVPRAARDAVTVTLTYHGHVPTGHRLLFARYPVDVYAVAVSHLPDGQTLCTVSACAVLKAISGRGRGLRGTTVSPTVSRVHPLPKPAPAEAASVRTEPVRAPARVSAVHTPAPGRPPVPRPSKTAGSTEEPPSTLLDFI